MDNIKKLFMPYELALIAKEKGFNEPCLGGYSDIGELRITRVSCQSDIKGFCLAPTTQQILDWLMKFHNIKIGIYPCEDSPKEFWLKVFRKNILYWDNITHEDFGYSFCFEAVMSVAFELIKKR